MDLKTEVDGVEPGSRKFLDGLVATTKPKINLLTPIGARMFYEELSLGCRSSNQKEARR